MSLKSRTCLVVVHHLGCAAFSCVHFSRFTAQPARWQHIQGAVRPPKRQPPIRARLLRLTQHRCYLSTKKQQILLGSPTSQHPAKIHTPASSGRGVSCLSVCLRGATHVPAAPGCPSLAWNSRACHPPSPQRREVTQPTSTSSRISLVVVLNPLGRLPQDVSLTK